MVLLGPLSLASIRPKSVQCAGVAIDDSDNGCMMAKSWDSLGMGRGGGGIFWHKGLQYLTYGDGGHYISRGGGIFHCLTHNILPEGPHISVLAGNITLGGGHYISGGTTIL